MGHGFGAKVAEALEHGQSSGREPIIHVPSRFRPRGIYRVVTDSVVNLSQPSEVPADRNLGNRFVRAHSNIAHVEVAHAWERAVLASR